MTSPERSVTVCIVGDGPGDDLLRGTLDSATAHTPPEVPVIVLGSATAADGHRDAPAHGDIVLLESGCLVAAGWLDALRDAAVSDGIVATASALTQHDLSVQPLTGFDDAAAAARTRSLRLRPRLPAARGPCVYVRRRALELIGESGARGLAHGLAHAELSRRCTEAGLAHVLADDVLVLDQRTGPEPSFRPPGDGGPVSRSVGRIRRAITGLSAVIDARILYGPTTGTQVHILEVIAGLARTGKVRLTTVLPDAPSEFARNRLQSLPHVALVTYAEASSSRVARADVVHRPFQFSNAGDLTFLRTLGDRLILTQQDLIGYHNPSYFPDLDAWRGYRQLTALALASADWVAFFSGHARDDAIGEDLVDPTRASVIRLGVDHPAATAEGPSAPTGVGPLADGVEAILCLGTDFHHKNRPFALRMLDRLKTRHDWDGVLVFAGPTVGHGSSREQEAHWLATHPQLEPAVLDVGAVSEAEKTWLFERSSLVLYPSVVEGFGLVPFEAAAHAVPSMWAPGGSLGELLPDDAAGIVPWDADRSADRALELMHEHGARERNLEAIRVAAEPLTWDATAAELVEVYEQAADSPGAPAGVLWSAGALTQGLLAEDAMRLVGPGGELPVDVQRPLLALATHPRLAAPLFGALKLTYRASHRLRRERGRHKRR